MTDKSPERTKKQNIRQTLAVTRLADFDKQTVTMEAGAKKITKKGNNYLQKSFFLRIETSGLNPYIPPVLKKIAMQFLKVPYC